MDKIIFLEPVFCERIWGGCNLKKFDFSIPQGNIGEAWVIAAHDNGSSKIINGQLEGLTLKEAYEKQPTLFTEKVYDKFPLLIKILDASDNLSVQVHPEDDYARENENGELGKTECWYVLDAKEGAKLVYGHTAKTKEEFNDKINDEQWQELFIEEEVKAGDFFYIPAGTLHAIGEGILIYEVQQNSDTTYRVYDYDRVDKDGNPIKNARIDVDFINGKLDMTNNTWTANKEAPKTSLRVFTDDNGVFAFVPSRSGQWVIRAVASMDKQNKVVHDASLVVQFE